MNVVIVTQCPGGTTTSFMAATALKKAAAELNWDVTVEIHSSVQPTEMLTDSQIQAADLVVIAADGAVEMGRFTGKYVYRGAVADCLENPKDWLQQAQRQASLSGSAAGSTAAAAPTQQTSSGALNIIAVTACPTGVAHTFMSAEALQEAGTAMGHIMKVETRGSVGAKNTLTDADIEAADLVILAVDIEVDTAPFVGKRVYRTSTSNALKKPKEVIERAITESAAVTLQPKSAEDKDVKVFKKEKTGAYKHLMTGVSFMLPVVVAGGLIIALSFFFGYKAFEQEGTLAAALMKIGQGSAFALMIPVLAGYIAYSIADRPGLAPGLVGGMLASSVGSGFLGGILAGFVAGYSAKFLVDKIDLPKTLEALKPILIVPLIATLLTGLVMIYIVGGPVSGIMNAMTEFLKSMSSANAVLLGVILGAMMCFDLGGPVNKAAYTFGVGLLASKTYEPMAAIMAAGMVPAIGMGIATFLSKNRFSAQEQEAGKASFVLGLCFISEGAIPFAAKDPLRVIPACMVGGSITGALSMLIHAELLAPHGGIFVLFIPSAITHVGMYVGAIAIGSVITAVGYLLLKRTTEGAVTVAG
ncbi:PTS fructose-like transporter subunit IIB [Gynuella sp.]|uniref:PTS fructose-like transporter subunit IIB n=1 Tax=Gynuella sp. TaxID=2969146 RepID=UPI003D0EDA7B